MTDEVLCGLDVALGYLNEILAFILDIETHLKHLEIIFQRLGKADLNLKKVNATF